MLKNYVLEMKDKIVKTFMINFIIFSTLATGLSAFPVEGSVTNETVADVSDSVSSCGTSKNALLFCLVHMPPSEILNLMT